MSHFRNGKGKNSNKLSKNSGATPLESAIHCTPIPLNPRLEKQNSNKSNRSILATRSDGSIIKNQEIGLKQKLVNKVKSWSNKDKSLRGETPSSSKPDPHETDVACGFANLSINNSEDQLEIFKAKDSLENILVGRTEMERRTRYMDKCQCALRQACGHPRCPRNNYQAHSRGPPLKTLSSESGNGDNSASCAQEMEITAATLHTDSLQQYNVTDTSTTMTWDPWNKSERKEKRKDKSPHTSTERTPKKLPIESKIHTAGDESQDNFQQDSYNDEYQPYRSIRKSVHFVKEVEVMYFAGDEIVNRAMEPLKNEIDQQVRNKEMRYGHVPCTLVNKKHAGGEDRTSLAWFKK